MKHDEEWLRDNSPNEDGDFDEYVEFARFYAEHMVAAPLEARIAELEQELAVRKHDVTPCQSARIANDYAASMTADLQADMMKLQARVAELEKAADMAYDYLMEQQERGE
jgi:uncharacterized protein YceH (UPF0502 family)